MKKWFVQGKVVELSDYDYYNQWLGLIMLTNGLGGLLSGYFDMHDRNGKLLENNANYLHKNILLVGDIIFVAILKNYEKQFMKVMELDKEAISTLAQILGLESPKSLKDYRTLYKKFQSEEPQINAQGFLDHHAFEKLHHRYRDISEKRTYLKNKIIAYIINAYPDVAQSEYLDNR
jgi:hypothetical protein